MVLARRSGGTRTASRLQATSATVDGEGAPAPPLPPLDRRPLMTRTTTTTTPAGRPAPAQPERDGGRRRRRRPRRHQREDSTWDSRTLDPDAPTGPVSAVLTLLLGGLELVAALSSWLGPSDDS